MPSAMVKACGAMAGSVIVGPAPMTMGEQAASASNSENSSERTWTSLLFGCRRHGFVHPRHHFLGEQPNSLVTHRPRHAKGRIADNEVIEAEIGQLAHAPGYCL